MEKDIEFNKIFLELLNGNVDNPDLLSRYVIQLSAHSFNVAKDVTEKQRAWAKKWQEERVNYKTDKQCEMALILSTEWRDYEDKKNSYKMIKELIMAAKKRLSVLSDQSRGNY